MDTLKEISESLRDIKILFKEIRDFLLERSPKAEGKCPQCGNDWSHVIDATGTGGGRMILRCRRCHIEYEKPLAGQPENDRPNGR